MPRSIARICGVPFRKIIKHKHKKNNPWFTMEVLACGHEVMCKEGSDICHASKRRCYTCKAEGMNGASKLGSCKSRKSEYPSARKIVREYFHLVLTDKQIKYYAEKNNVLKRDLADDVFDTMDRDYFIDEVVADVLGEKYHWPLNGDPSSYAVAFYPVFYERAVQKKLGVTPEVKQFLMHREFVRKSVEAAGLGNKRMI
jgi:hypothetical protein